MYSVADNQLTLAGFPHSEISGYNACLSAHPSLSQISTSFIAFCRLGIHRMHLVTWPYNPKKSFTSRQLPYASSGSKFIDNQLDQVMFCYMNWILDKVFRLTQNNFAKEYLCLFVTRFILIVKERLM